MPAGTIPVDIEPYGRLSAYFAAPKPTLTASFQPLGPLTTDDDASGDISVNADGNVVLAGGGKTYIVQAQVKANSPAEGGATAATLRFAAVPEKGGDGIGQAHSPRDPDGRLVPSLLAVLHVSEPEFVVLLEAAVSGAESAEVAYGGIDVCRIA
jgi:hypothetical protein